jgi:hypothetical protein
MTEAELVEQLARLPDEKRRDVTKAAGAERQRRIKAATQHVGDTLLSGWSGRKMARAIADAAHDRHGTIDPALRLAVKQELQRQLGHLDDFPETDRIRQLVAVVIGATG